jgi:tRNA (mo5U34)-methyltransferase
MSAAPSEFSLDGWYHTIDLGDGLVSRGYWDHRTIVDCYGIPESLAGKTALDVGTADGFWAFELERRGADRVVAIDVETHADFDWLPGRMPPHAGQHLMKRNFDIAHARLGSSVEHITCSVYDLSPEVAGKFDVVFCGSLLLHLMNPIRAMINIRSVVEEVAIIESLAEPGLDAIEEPLLRFGHSNSESEPGEAGIYWRFGRRAMQELLTYTGFERSELMPPFLMPPHNFEAVAIHGYPSQRPPAPVHEPRRFEGLRDTLGPTLHRAPLLGHALAARRRRRLGA